MRRMGGRGFDDGSPQKRTTTTVTVAESTQIDELKKQIADLEAQKRAALSGASGGDGAAMAMVMEQLQKLTDAQRLAAERLKSPKAGQGNSGDADRFRAERDAMAARLEEEKQASDALRKQLATLQQGFDSLLKEKNTLAGLLGDEKQRTESTKYDLMKRVTDISVQSKTLEHESSAAIAGRKALEHELSDVRAHNHSLQKLLEEEKKRSAELLKRLKASEEALRNEQSKTEEYRRQLGLSEWESSRLRGGKGMARWRYVVKHKVFPAFFERKYKTMQSDRAREKWLNYISRKMRGERYTELQKTLETRLMVERVRHEKERNDLQAALKQAELLAAEYRDKLEKFDRRLIEVMDRNRELAAQNDKLNKYTRPLSASSFALPC